MIILMATQTYNIIDKRKVYHLLEQQEESFTNERGRGSREEEEKGRKRRDLIMKYDNTYVMYIHTRVCM